MTFAEYLNKMIIISIYTNLPHPAMQNVASLNKRYGMTVLLLQWKEIEKKNSVSLTLLQTKYSAMILL